MKEISILGSKESTLEGASFFQAWCFHTLLSGYPSCGPLASLFLWRHPLWSPPSFSFHTHWHSCNPGVSLSPLQNLLCFSPVCISCFLDPAPSFFLGLWFYFGGAWEIKFLRLLRRNLMPCSFPIFLYVTRFFLSSLVALISFLHPQCSEISP